MKENLSRIIIWVKISILILIIKNFKKKKMKNWKTTLVGATLAILYLVQSAYKDAQMNIHNLDVFDLIISSAIILFGALSKDFDVTGTAKTLLIFFTMCFYSQTSHSQQRYEYAIFPLPNTFADGSPLIAKNGFVAVDSASVGTDSSEIIVKENTVGKYSTTYYNMATRTGSQISFNSVDSLGIGSSISSSSNLSSGHGANLSSDVCENCYVNKIGVDSVGVYIDAYNSKTENLISFHLPKNNMIQWNGQMGQSGIVTSGILSTVSGIDTIYLTTDGTENGENIYSNSTEYSVILSPVSSDSTVYSYNVTKTDSYFVVLARKSNSLFHFSLVSDATKVDYVTVGN